MDGPPSPFLKIAPIRYQPLQFAPHAQLEYALGRW
jgi:hypothetical protein